MKRALAHTLAMVGGAATWIAVCRVTGEAEAWDTGYYTTAVLPGLAALLAVLGFWVRERPAALGIAASLGQMIGLVLTRGAHAMWPVDVAIFFALALPLGLSAWLGGGVRGVMGRVVRVGRSGARFCSRRRHRHTEAPERGSSPATAVAWPSGVSADKSSPS